MRAPIQRLPDEVVDQIAAGEVIERPASLVKELCENAIDAGARVIRVEIEGGGRDLVRVVDDGHGMTEDELPLAFTRHATSKLRNVDALVGIRSHGFRGEALPSIASVARVVVTTKSEGANAGVRFEIHGEKSEMQPAASPVGTEIVITELFRNTPVRLKFLKGQGTEVGHVLQTVRRLALAHPKIHFVVQSQGRTAFEAPSHASTAERVAHVLKERTRAPLFRVDGEEVGARIAAFLAPPQETLGASSAIHLFVNNRGIRDRNLSHAVRLGYGELLGRGRYPIAAVFIDLPVDSVDLNVHPQKTEVRFEDANAVYAAVRRTLRRGIVRAGWHIQASASPVTTAKTPSAAVTVAAAPRASGPDKRAYASPLGQKIARYHGKTLRESAPQQSTLWRAPGKTPTPVERDLPPEIPQAQPQTVTTTAPRAAPGFRYLGVVDGQWLLCESDAQLLFLSPRRLWACRVATQLRARPPRQLLLVPAAIPDWQLSQEDSDALGITIVAGQLLACPPFLSSEAVSACSNAVTVDDFVTRVSREMGRRLRLPLLDADVFSLLTFMQSSDVADWAPATLGLSLDWLEKALTK